ncbi:hypothetical protein NEUTE1DRAFT_116231 [Neurospora tetrasperma FGSC 2508]|uniref:Uncharacterized protein n=1 Tax=Neurospora tetrasperma (strain FGSC 2508 / ATCC MYA-4615 / P0657) TaxID=510951 RepID=F8MGY0_NEUT8|nr:uncharacterized protein NEUTE1DRAFT_116231 [Neurospora tetrasperma FGSC 2508]EGO58699.1 hypothetical protein NEUTE1DRAFT_116231 [Neurospora tetrasperma FGSC 2508]EGZ72786.1 hypothetical protein NEUTE2DRAFT_143925 [Neurospora tetrasperma FGSC 2509]
MAQPQVRRRTSLHDKLKIWQKPLPLLDTVPDNEAERPRSSYRPKHAAADFSRLTTTPPPSILNVCRPQITESETSQISPSQTRRAYRRPESANPLAEMRFRGQRRDMASAFLQQEHSKLAHPPRQPPQTVKRSVPLTDYELFLARAELEERAHRDLLQTMNAQLHDSLHDLIRPDPHQQFASLSPTRLSAGSTAVPGISRTTTGNKSRESRTSWAPSSATGNTVAEIVASQQHEESLGAQPHHVSSNRQSLPDAKSHSVVLNGVKASIHRSGTVGRISDDGHAQQPRAPTLKRQASFAQKIAEYIRPPRRDAMDICRNETTLKLTRSRSQAGLRRLVAVPIHHIEALAE